MLNWENLSLMLHMLVTPMAIQIPYLGTNDRYLTGCPFQVDKRDQVGYLMRLGRLLL